jgi:hypothetical protein
MVGEWMDVVGCVERLPLAGVTLGNKGCHLTKSTEVTHSLSHIQQQVLAFPRADHL